MEIAFSQAISIHSNFLYLLIDVTRLISSAKEKKNGTNKQYYREPKHNYHIT